MKRITLLVCFIVSLSGFGQANLKPGTKARDASRSVQNGYTTKLGWQLKVGDTLQLGIGSRQRQAFNYIYSSPVSFAQVLDSDVPITYLDNDYNNQIAIIKRFGAKGKKKIGYKAYAVVGLGELENFWVEIEDAIQHAEVIPPNPQYAPKKEVLEVKVVGQSQTDKYDQLAKLKTLFDDGILTEEEYKAEKSKLLSK
jgi:hypothetical protein